MFGMEQFAVLLAVLAVVLLAIPVVIILYFAVAVVQTQIPYWRTKKIVRHASTEFGVLEHTNLPWGSGMWEGNVRFADRECSLSVTDVNGQPNEEFLKRLPTLLQELETLEAVARRTLPEITPEHELSGLSDDGDIELGFSFDNDCWGETIFVKMSEGEVADWDSVD